MAYLTKITKNYANQLRRDGRSFAKQDNVGALATGEHLYNVNTYIVRDSDQDVPLWMHYGYASIQHYAEAEMGIPKSRALETIRTWWVFGDVLAGRVKAGRIEALGRGRTVLLARLLLLQALRNSGLRKIEPYTDVDLKLTDAQVALLVGSAEKLTVSELEKLYRTARSSYRKELGLVTDPSTALYEFSSRVTADELAVIEKGIQKAKQADLGTRKGQALAGIVREWLISVKGKAKGTKATALAVKSTKSAKSASYKPARAEDLRRSLPNY